MTDFVCAGSRRLKRLAPGTMYELDVQKIVNRNLKSLFPSYIGKFISPKFRTDYGNVEPDFVLLRADLMAWGLVEVETSSDSFPTHILPQLSKLSVATAEGTRSSSVMSAFSGTAGQSELKAAFSRAPQVFLVNHGSSKDFLESLHRMQITVFDIDIFYSPPDEYVLTVVDNSDTYKEVQTLARRSQSRLTGDYWVLSPWREPLNFVERDKVQVRFAGVECAWRVSQSDGDLLLRPPSTLAIPTEINQGKVYMHLDTGDLRIEGLQT